MQRHRLVREGERRSQTLCGIAGVVRKGVNDTRVMIDTRNHKFAVGLAYQQPTCLNCRRKMVKLRKLRPV